jgi:hypothetical protein
VRPGAGILGLISAHFILPALSSPPLHICNMHICQRMTRGDLNKDSLTPTGKAQVKYNIVIVEFTTTYFIYFGYFHYTQL